MAVNFPNSPTNGQEYSFAGNTWLFNGRGWVQNPKPLGSGNKNENIVINGNFDIWQRGITSTVSSGYSNGVYVADRFLHAADGSSTGSFTVSQQAFIFGQTEVPDSPRYYLRFATTSFANSANGFTYLVGHRIEDVTKFSGKTLTISFYARASSSAGLRISLSQNFGTSGSTSVITSVGSPTLTTAFQKYIFTLTLPSVSGKTIGANSYLYLEIFGGILGTTATTYGVTPLTILNNGTYDFSQIKVEEGAIATPVGYTVYADEEVKCLRYTPSILGLGYYGTGLSTNATLAYVYIDHQVRPRIPASSITTSGNFLLINAAGSTVAVTSLSLNSSSLGGVVLTIGTASGLNSLAPVLFYSNGGKIIFNGCEL